jgi:endonuclease/exonuclease/phosphatase family metal-dependent hydrolase
VYKTTVRAAVLLALLLTTVRAAAAAPYIWVDLPAKGTSVGSWFVVAGWSLDFAATKDTGISQIHAWAYPADGGAPRFVGTMTRASRPDVGALFGARYANAGFTIAGTLPAGRYVLVLTPWSSVTNGFVPEASVVWPLTVNASAAPASTPTPAPKPAPSPSPDPVPSPASSAQLRVLQWNTHHGGYGTDGVYSPDRIATWVAKINPDVVFFNEIEKNDYWGHQDQPEVYKSLLQQKTGHTWYYVFAQEFGEWSANGKGNLIFSRYPINVTDRHELVHNADRSVAMATITVNNRDITLISTHLDPDDQSLRLTQATEVTGWAAAQPENRIIAGDMNAWPDQSSIAQFNKTYKDSWAVAKANGTATAFSGNNGETKKGRIDYIFYSSAASALSVRSSQVFDTRDANGQMPSDHRPVFTIFNVR